MEFDGRWNLGGLRPEMRNAARDVARRSDLATGDWLTGVIRPGEPD